MKGIFFLAILIFIFSCSNIYSTGDRYYKKSNFINAVDSYESQLKKDTISNEQKDTLTYKIALSNHKLGNTEKALKDLAKIEKVPSGIECDFYGLKITLLNALGSYDKNSEYSELLDRIDQSACSIETEEIDRFYSGLRNLYYPQAIRAGDRFLIRGNLKMDIKDELSAFSYYKKALIENPTDPEYILKLFSTFTIIEKEIASQFEKKQLSEFFSNDLPEFYEFVSKLYNRGKDSSMPSSPQILKALDKLTDNFLKVKTTRPVSVYNCFKLQDISNLIKTYAVNESFKIYKIEEGEDRAQYIVYSAEDHMVGITGKVNANSFISEK